MRSPFPGMDPYLEQHWGDVHSRFITYPCEQIQGHLPGDLRARMGERVFVESAESRGRDIGIALAEPLVVHLAQDEPVRQGFIEIIDIKSGRRVVTVIEFLSPSNKLADPGRELYIKKQKELRAGAVSLVEVNLLRTGPRVMSVPFDRIPDGHRTPYAACVRRGWKPLEVEYDRIPLRDRLPAIGVPLRRDEGDAPLDLQAILEHAYEAGHYGDDIDNTEEPELTLLTDDAKWADDLLRE